MPGCEFICSEITMQNHEETEQPARADQPDVPAGDQAPSNQAPPAPLMPKSHRKRSRATPAGSPATRGAGPLELPRGGLVAMRMSGGFRFSSREICVYRSGKVAYIQTAPALISQTRQLPLSQLVGLHVALKDSGMERLMLPGGRQSGDTFAYEIVARVGRAVRSVEVFEGGIPASLGPLIRELKQLMPEDAGEDAPPASEPETGE
jgi:hypothetical protein